jgi:polyhydroxyalkanoate synthesis regulator protein
MTQTAKPPTHPAPHIVKRYAGARLYDTGAAAYVTVDQLRAMVRSDVKVLIYDADDGTDITRSVLATH